MRREYLQDRLLFFAPLSADTQDKVSGQYGVVGSKASVTLNRTRRAHLIRPTAYYDSTGIHPDTGLIFDLPHLNLSVKDFTIMARCEATVLCEYSTGWFFRIAAMRHASLWTMNYNSTPAINRAETGKLYKFAWRIKDVTDMYYNGTVYDWFTRSTIDNYEQISIGATYDGREAYHSEAYISDFRIYDGTLTPEEIEAIWEGGY